MSRRSTRPVATQATDADMTTKTVTVVEVKA